GPQLRPSCAKLPGALLPGVNVDRVREDTHAFPVRAAGDERLARRRPQREPTGGLAQHARNHGPLDRTPPSAAWAEVVTLDERQVRNSPPTRPGDRGLRRERAPARDDDDIRARVTQGPGDSRCDGIVVV